jgi:DNA-binding beta-propeller fold protein YncE
MKRITIGSSLLCGVALLFIGLNASSNAAVSASTGPTLNLEIVWKADTATHPIMGGGSIAVDGQGNLYVTDYGMDGYTFQIVKFDPEGQFVSAWGKTGTGPGEFNWRPGNLESPPDAEAGPDAGFIAADAEGNLYVADGYNFRVQKFDAMGNYLLEWGGPIEDRGQERSCRLRSLGLCLEWESAGDDYGQRRPCRLRSLGLCLEWAPVAKRDGEFGFPGAGPIAIDSLGNVYVSDFAHVQRFNKEGLLLSEFGMAGTGDGEFNGAAQVGWDSQGNLYVPDLLNGRFQKFDGKGNFLLTFGVAGEGDGEFGFPLQAVVDSQDHVFVTDNTNRLQIFDTDGNFLAKWTDPGNGDGPFAVLGAVAVDREDNLYIAYYREEDGITIYKFRQE